MSTGGSGKGNLCQTLTHQNLLWVTVAQHRCSSCHCWILSGYYENFARSGGQPEAMLCSWDELQKSRSGWEASREAWETVRFQCLSFCSLSSCVFCFDDFPGDFSGSKSGSQTYSLLAHVLQFAPMQTSETQ